MAGGRERRLCVFSVELWECSLRHLETMKLFLQTTLKLEVDAKHGSGASVNDVPRCPIPVWVARVRTAV
jgi:hypothetical protein